MATTGNFTFNISLSVLNHLGRNLYRSFVTVLGEAISNSWDADAKNVWITIDQENSFFVIKDDGEGMSNDDFQNKFLKIGYSKRKDGNQLSTLNRPYIGRKGIGKLALLSCANKITVISKKDGGEYVGGCIDNSGLDDAITDDLSVNEYKLGGWDTRDFDEYLGNHGHGTVIRFDGINGGIKNTLSYIKKIVALYFKFSLIDEQFNIFIDGEKITHRHTGSIGEKTEFLWRINDYKDPFIEECLTSLKEDSNIQSNLNIKGFIASVVKPKDLKIRNTDEKLTLDLFVNGRLREKDILKNIPTNRIVESYLYGQIHFDELDDNDDDPFTSSREGVKSENSEFQSFLSEIKVNILPVVMATWDVFRRSQDEDGDSDNEDEIDKKSRKSEELFNVLSSEFSLDGDDENKDQIEGWVRELKDDARFCFSSYAECFISENLLRRYIVESRIDTNPALQKVNSFRSRENRAKASGNISIEIRKNNDDLSYLGMTHLAELSDRGKNNDKIKDNSLLRDSYAYKPLRDALMHTALLSEQAKISLTVTYENIKGRLKELLRRSV